MAAEDIRLPAGLRSLTRRNMDGDNSRIIIGQPPLHFIRSPDDDNDNNKKFNLLFNGL